MNQDQKTREVVIILNGDERRVPADLSVSDLLDELGLEAGMVVVEVNREILRRDTLSDVEVLGGDRIELVHFVGGG